MLNVELLPKQGEVFLPDEGVDYDIKLYQGGVGSGKTFLGSLTGQSVLATNHGATWLVGADTWERLKLTTWETWLELLDGAKIKHRSNKSDHVITINGWDDARVIFKGIDDPLALRSVNGIGGHLEEASMLSEASYLEFLGRLRQSTGGKAVRLVLTTNPQAQKGWLHEHFHTNGGISIEEVRGNEVRISRRRVITATLDNPHVSDAFIASLKASYDEDLYKIMVLGEDGDYTKGLVSHNFDRQLNVQDTNYKPDLAIYLSCDFNVDPMSWVIAHRYNGEYHFFDELVVENTVIEDCVDKFIEKYPEHRAGIIITGDASGGARNVQNPVVGGTSYTQMVNRFEKRNYQRQCRISVDIRSENPAILDRVAAWNGMMHNKDGIRRIFISPKCKHLIQNLQNLKYKDGTSKIEKPSDNDIKKDNKKKFLGHIFDAASYLVEKYDPITLKVKTPLKGTVVPTAMRNL